MEIIYYIVIPSIAALLGAYVASVVERRRSKSHYEEKYWEKQIDFYIKLWPALQGLKSSADDLWEEATREILEIFVDNLNDAEQLLQDNKLLIDDNHFQELNGLIGEFWKFGSGKARLLDLREEANIIEIINPKEIVLIKRNGQTKDKYDQIISEIEKQFRDKLRHKKQLEQSSLMSSRN